MKLSASALVLIVANLVPLFGVVALGWDVGLVLLLYWAENVVYGLLSLVKILTAGGFGADGFGWLARIWLSIFFVFHYGIFTLVHGVFVVMLFNRDRLPAEGAGVAMEVDALVSLFSLSAPASGSIGVAVLGLAASHAFSLLLNWFARGEYVRSDPGTEMGRPYGRIFVLHAVILVGGGLVSALGQPWLAIALLVVLKTGMDVVSHGKSHEPTASERGGGADVFQS